MHDSTIKHLEMIQGVVNRMGQSSFAMKGWAVVVVAALFALASSESNSQFALLALFPTFVFWGLDAYYMRQERLFRELYNMVRKLETPTDFSMDTRPYLGQVQSWYRTMASKTVGCLYGVIILAIAVVMWAR